MPYSINIICTKQYEDKFHYFIIIKNNEVEVDEWKYRINELKYQPIIEIKCL